MTIYDLPFHRSGSPENLNTGTPERSSPRSRGFNHLLFSNQSMDITWGFPARNMGVPQIAGCFLSMGNIPSFEMDDVDWGYPHDELEPPFKEYQYHGIL